jgi:hypothetical protein
MASHDDAVNTISRHASTIGTALLAAVIWSSCSLPSMWNWLFQERELMLLPFQIFLRLPRTASCSRYTFAFSTAPEPSLLSLAIDRLRHLSIGAYRLISHAHSARSA